MNEFGKKIDAMPMSPEIVSDQEAVEKIPHVAEEDRRDSRKQLEKPLAIEKDDPQGGEMQLAAENVKIDLSYSHLNKQESDELASFKNNNSNAQAGGKNEVSIDHLPNADEWRVLDRFMVNNGQEQKDLTKIMPEISKYKIFFCPGLPQEKHSASMDHDRKNIYIMGNMTSLLDVVELLHQVGHVWGEKEQDMGASDSMLQKEEYATKFSMKLLKPFLGGENGKHIENVVYGNYNETKEKFEGEMQSNSDMVNASLDHPDPNLEK